MSCRYDRETGKYLIDGEECKRDDYGDVTNHCTAKKTCAHHIGTNEQTCGRCLGDTRNDIAAVAQFAALMPTEALVGGVNSEAANLAGPAANVEAWSWRKTTAKQALMASERDPNSRDKARLAALTWHVSMLEEDDDWHPWTVLTRWHWLVSAAYGHDLPEVMTLTAAAAYLDRNLFRIAQDASDTAPDFAEMRAEIRRCRTHLESVLHNSSAAEKGAPCPTCSEDGKFIRLVRSFGHWCWDDGCEKIHYADTSGDRWTCPRDKQHWWTEQAYRSWVEERTA